MKLKIFIIIIFLIKFNLSELFFFQKNSINFNLINLILLNYIIYKKIKKSSMKILYFLVFLIFFFISSLFRNLSFNVFSGMM